MSGKIVSGLPWTETAYEAGRRKGYELGLTLYAIRDKAGNIIQTSPGLYGLAVLYTGRPVGSEGWSPRSMMRQVERLIAKGSIPSVKVDRTRQPVVSGEVRAQIESYLHQLAREYQLEPVAG